MKDNKLDKLENRLSLRIDTLLVKALGNMQGLNSLNKSKTSIRHIQEQRVIQAFRRTKKQVAKANILKMQKNTTIPYIKAKLMQKLGKCKSTFKNN